MQRCTALLVSLSLTKQQNWYFKKNAVILFISKTRYNVSFYTINLGFPKLVVYEYNMA